MQEHKPPISTGASRHLYFQALSAKGHVYRISVTAQYRTCAPLLSILYPMARHSSPIHKSILLHSTPLHSAPPFHYHVPLRLSTFSSTVQLSIHSPHPPLTFPMPRSQVPPRRTLRCSSSFRGPSTIHVISNLSTFSAKTPSPKGKKKKGETPEICQAGITLRCSRFD